MPAKLKLLLVCFSEIGEDGDPANYDLFVVAEDAAQAKKLWFDFFTAEYYQELDDKESDTYDKEHAQENIEEWEKREPSLIYEVPHEALLNQNPHAVPWREMESLI